jgi:hypothetical protein
MVPFRRFTVVGFIAALALLTLVQDIAASSFLFSRIPDSQVDTAQRDKAERIVEALYEKWQAGQFEPLSDEFTAEMQKGLTPQLQEQAFRQVKGMFGDFNGMTFVEVMTARFIFPKGTIYRFKGSYSQSSEQPEIRVVFDSDGKVSGLWIKPWKDDIQ